MTATVTPVADLDGVIHRADARWARRHGDEPAAPEYLKQIVDAVRPLLDQPTAGPDVQAAPAEDTEALREQLAAVQAEVDRLYAALAAQAKELGQARAELRNRPPADVVHQRLTAAAGDVTLREKLAAAAGDVERLTAEVTRLQEQLADQDDVALAEHTCLYPIAEPGAEPGPCDVCRRPYPRSADAYELEEELPPDVEPWAALFGRIRDEAAEAGWTA
ncbi:hypothetical protein AB0J55_17580 [Amycolatopsis sp. NPDC049688]|uniref:hypothetical protein n=1 Tax=Amycolatopsis sp. NPDC049688 TaxID=3154733 RepID=UPI00341396EC